jgi:hypothetical protein
MNIPKQILNSWKIQLKHGEIGVISKKIGISRNTVSNAIANGNCEQETFDQLKAYFQEKKEEETKMIKEVLK